MWVQSIKIESLALPVLAESRWQAGSSKLMLSGSFCKPASKCSGHPAPMSARQTNALDDMTCYVELIALTCAHLKSSNAPGSMPFQQLVFGPSSCVSNVVGSRSAVAARAAWCSDASSSGFAFVQDCRA